MQENLKSTMFANHEIVECAEDIVQNIDLFYTTLQGVKKNLHLTHAKVSNDIENYKATKQHQSTQEAKEYFHQLESFREKVKDCISMLPLETIVKGRKKSLDECLNSKMEVDEHTYFLSSERCNELNSLFAIVPYYQAGHNDSNITSMTFAHIIADHLLQRLYHEATTSTSTTSREELIQAVGELFKYHNCFSATEFKSYIVSTFMRAELLKEIRSLANNLEIINNEIPSVQSINYTISFYVPYEKTFENFKQLFKFLIHPFDKAHQDVRENCEPFINRTAIYMMSEKLDFALDETLGKSEMYRAKSQKWFFKTKLLYISPSLDPVERQNESREIINMIDQWSRHQPKIINKKLMSRMVRRITRIICRAIPPQDVNPWDPFLYLLGKKIAVKSGIDNSPFNEAFLKINELVKHDDEKENQYFQPHTKKLIKSLDEQITQEEKITLTNIKNAKFIEDSVKHDEDSLKEIIRTLQDIKAGVTREKQVASILITKNTIQTILHHIEQLCGSVQPTPKVSNNHELLTKQLQKLIKGCSAETKYQINLIKPDIEWAYQLYEEAYTALNSSDNTVSAGQSAKNNQSIKNNLKNHKEKVDKITWGFADNILENLKKENPENFITPRATDYEKDERKLYENAKQTIQSIADYCHNLPLSKNIDSTILAFFNEWRECIFKEIPESLRPNQAIHDKFNEDVDQSKTRKYRLPCFTEKSGLRNEGNPSNPTETLTKALEEISGKIKFNDSNNADHNSVLDLYANTPNDKKAELVKRIIHELPSKLQQELITILTLWKSLKPKTDLSLLDKLDESIKKAHEKDLYPLKFQDESSLKKFRDSVLAIKRQNEARNKIVESLEEIKRLYPSCTYTKNLAPPLMTQLIEYSEKKSETGIEDPESSTFLSSFKDLKDIKNLVNNKDKLIDKIIQEHVDEKWKTTVTETISSYFETEPELKTKVEKSIAPCLLLPEKGSPESTQTVLQLPNNYIRNGYVWIAWQYLLHDTYTQVAYSNIKRLIVYHRIYKYEFRSLIAERLRYVFRDEEKNSQRYALIEERTTEYRSRDRNGEKINFEEDLKPLLLYQPDYAILDSSWFTSWINNENGWEYFQRLEDPQYFKKITTWFMDQPKAFWNEKILTPWLTNGCVYEQDAEAVRKITLEFIVRYLVGEVIHEFVKQKKSDVELDTFLYDLVKLNKVQYMLIKNSRSILAPEGHFKSIKQLVSKSNPLTADGFEHIYCVFKRLINVTTEISSLVNSRNIPSYTHHQTADPVLSMLFQILRPDAISARTQNQHASQKLIERLINRNFDRQVIMQRTFQWLFKEKANIRALQYWATSMVSVLQRTKECIAAMKWMLSLERSLRSSETQSFSKTDTIKKIIKMIKNYPNTYPSLTLDVLQTSLEQKEKPIELADAVNEIIKKISTICAKKSVEGYNVCDPSPYGIPKILFCLMPETLPIDAKVVNRIKEDLESLKNIVNDEEDLTEKKKRKIYSIQSTLEGAFKDHKSIADNIEKAQQVTEEKIKALNAVHRFYTEILEHAERIDEFQENLQGKNPSITTYDTTDKFIESIVSMLEEKINLKEMYDKEAIDLQLMLNEYLLNGEKKQVLRSLHQTFFSKVKVKEDISKKVESIIETIQCELSERNQIKSAIEEMYGMLSNEDVDKRICNFDRNLYKIKEILSKRKALQKTVLLSVIADTLEVNEVYKHLQKKIQEIVTPAIADKENMFFQMHEHPSAKFVSIFREIEEDKQTYPIKIENMNDSTKAQIEKILSNNENQNHTIIIVADEFTTIKEAADFISEKIKTPPAQKITLELPHTPINTDENDIITHLLCFEHFVITYRHASLDLVFDQPHIFEIAKNINNYIVPEKHKIFITNLLKSHHISEVIASLITPLSKADDKLLGQKPIAIETDNSNIEYIKELITQKNRIIELPPTYDNLWTSVLDIETAYNYYLFAYASVMQPAYSADIVFVPHSQTTTQNPHGFFIHEQVIEENTRIGDTDKQRVCELKPDAKIAKSIGLKVITADIKNPYTGEKVPKAYQHTYRTFWKNTKEILHSDTPIQIFCNDLLLNISISDHIAFQEKAYTYCSEQEAKTMRKNISKILEKYNSIASMENEEEDQENEEENRSTFSYNYELAYQQSELRSIVCSCMQQSESLFYIWPILIDEAKNNTHDKAEPIYLYYFSELRNKCQEHYDNKGNNITSRVRWVQHVLFGWGQILSTAKVFYELSEAYALVSKDKDNQALKKEIEITLIHLIAFENIDMQEQKVTVTPAENGQEGRIQDAFENLITHGFPKRNHIRHLGEIYKETQNTYALMLLVQIRLSAEFKKMRDREHGLTNLVDKGKKCIALLQDKIKHNPNAMVAKILMGACYLTGIGTSSQDIDAARCYLEPLGIKVCTDAQDALKQGTELLSTDFLRWELGRLSYNLITGDKPDKEPLPISEEVMQYIHNNEKYFTLPQVSDGFLQFFKHQTLQNKNRHLCTILQLGLLLWQLEKNNCELNKSIDQTIKTVIQNEHTELQTISEERFCMLLGLHPGKRALTEEYLTCKTSSSESKSPTLNFFKWLW